MGYSVVPNPTYDDRKSRRRNDRSQWKDKDVRKDEKALARKLKRLFRSVPELKAAKLKNDYQWTDWTKSERHIVFTTDTEAHNFLDLLGDVIDQEADTIGSTELTYRETNGETIIDIIVH